jgi:hypothetical protein
MQSAETVLGVLRERGRRGLPLAELYRQLFNPQLYLLAYGRIYSNKGAMTPGPDAETADGMTMGKIERIIDAVRHERYRFMPVRRLYIPKKDGKQRPLGLPSWSDKLVGEVVRLLLEAYYEPQFSDHSHGYRPGRGCHTALREVAVTWTGTTWFIEGDRCSSPAARSRAPDAPTVARYAKSSHCNRRAPLRPSRPHARISARPRRSEPANSSATMPRPYVFCVLTQFHRHLKRREIYANASSRWRDPRARRDLPPRHQGRAKPPGRPPLSSPQPSFTARRASCRSATTRAWKTSSARSASSSTASCCGTPAT